MQKVHAVVLLGAITWTTLLAGTGRTDDVSIPSRMAYVGRGASIMGLDRDAPLEPANTRSASHRRMRGPWSAEAFHDEGPAHTVFLDSYFMDQYEVSNREYGEFIRAEGHTVPAYWDDPRLNTPEQPVVGVSWHDAAAYCQFRGKRLPTEAEWEKAARGPFGNVYPWGHELDPTKANFGKTHEATMPIDAYPDGVSYYGVYNMAGNVFEWVADWYDPRYYERADARVNPTGPAQPPWIGGTGTYVDRLTVGAKRVIRGGSWIAPAATIRSTHRFWNDPLNNSYGVGLGFRCAKTAPADFDRAIRDASVAALIDMGRERYADALHAVRRGLRLDPTNAELVELQALLESRRGLNAGTAGNRMEAP